MSNATRKSSRNTNREPVVRIVPITLVDEDEKVSSTSEPIKQSDIKPSSTQASKPTVSSNREPQKPTPGKSGNRRGRSATTEENQNSSPLKESVAVQDSSSSSKADEICTSVKQLTLSPKNDTDEEKIREENLGKLELPQRSLPPYNVPEKIIIVLDRAGDVIFTNFELNNGTRYPPLTMLKRSVFFFLNNKNAFDSRHEFALLVLNENSATWLHDFTNNVDRILNTFEDIEECETEDIFDMNSVLDLINKKVKVPETNTDLLIPPPYVVRTVFLYGRSFTTPVLTLTEEISNLLNSPYFTFDVLMTHETPDSGNKCNMIFAKLQELDTKGFAYFFPVSRSSSELHQSMAKLLSHPLQRPHQKVSNYKLSL